MDQTGPIRAALICQHGDDLAREGLGRWLASFTDLVGIVVIHETWARAYRRVRRELRRVGPVRLVDVLAMRLYARLFLRSPLHQWRDDTLAGLRRRYPPVPTTTPVLHTPNPNGPDVEEFLRRHAPTMTLAVCKNILTTPIYSIPVTGTFVVHPGICPQYRNAHGCFWALARDDLQNVGATLLRIDAGVDTGPVYAYFRSPIDEISESHLQIQQRQVFDNLVDIRTKLIAIHEGRAAPLDTRDRPSAAWGQPWFTRYVRWKRRARKRHAEHHLADVS